MRWDAMRCNVCEVRRSESVYGGGCREDGGGGGGVDGTDRQSVCEVST